MTFISNTAFSDCTSLTDVYYGGSEEQWNAISFNQYNANLQNANLHFNASIRVFINGTPVEFDQPPVIVNDRTLVPFRTVFEALGAEVGWDEATQTVTGTRQGRVITLQIGGSEMLVDGQIKYLDVPAQLLGGRTLIPVRAVS